MPSVNRSVGKSKLIRDFRFPVPASDTVDYIYNTVNQFRSTNLLVEVEETVTNEVRTFNVTLSPTASEDPEDTLFSKVGDNLNFSFNVLKIGSDIVIRVANNESNTILVSAIRITF